MSDCHYSKSRQYYWTTLICILTESFPTAFERLKQPKLLVESRINSLGVSKLMLAEYRNTFQKFP